MLTVGDTFPQFSCQACVGTGKDDMKVLTNADYAGKWVVYFFYPKDFTFVCPTEIIAYNEYAEEFRKNGCEVRQRESVRERMKERKRETV